MSRITDVSWLRRRYRAISPPQCLSNKWIGKSIGFIERRAQTNCRAISYSGWLHQEVEGKLVADLKAKGLKVPP